jgi:hypothetical protein
MTRHHLASIALLALTIACGGDDTVEQTSQACKAASECYPSIDPKALRRAGSMAAGGELLLARVRDLRITGDRSTGGRAESGVHASYDPRDTCRYPHSWQHPMPACSLAE